MATRRIKTNRPLQTKAQRNEVYGRSFAYARGLLDHADGMYIGDAVGNPPYSAVDGRTIAMRAWQDGYEAALRDVRQGKRTP